MAKPKDKQPWFKFYPQDWRGDAELRSCSIGARGLWVEMLCIMHQADPYGYLLINGKQVVPRQMSKLAGISDVECMKFILELESAGVYSRAEDKSIYSRRMVRDKAKSEQAKTWGKGGGNPELTGNDKGRVNPPVNGMDKPQKPEARIQTPESISEKRERPLSDLYTRSEKDRPKPIDELYQPSEPAIEYAYSLKMKKADLDSELSKFRNHCVSLRIASYNPDANFKKWCDQWFDYQRKNPPKAASVVDVAPPELTAVNWTSYVKNWLLDESRWPRGIGGPPGSATCRCPDDVLISLQIDPETGWLMSRLVKIVSTTDEMSALVAYRQSKNLRPPKVYQIEIDGREQTARWEKNQWPPGYNDFGERVPVGDEDAA